MTANYSPYIHVVSIHTCLHKIVFEHVFHLLNLTVHGNQFFKDNLISFITAHLSWIHKGTGIKVYAHYELKFNIHC